MMINKPKPSLMLYAKPYNISNNHHQYQPAASERIAAARANDTVSSFLSYIAISRLISRCADVNCARASSSPDHSQKSLNF